MRVKNLLLASTALALLGTAQPAQADMYVSVFGGANWLEDSSGFGTNVFFCGKFSCTSIGRFSTDADTGFVLGGAIGVHLDNWLRGLRAEIEASYRRHDVGGRWATSFFVSGFGPYTSSSGAIEANQSTFAVMANVWYDIDMNWRVKPYVGAGVGWARAKVDGAFRTFSGFNTTTAFSRHDNGFAWQLGAGFNYEVQPGVNVGVGYRYFQGPDVELFFSGKLGNIVNAEIENNNHSVLVNLNIDIN